MRNRKQVRIGFKVPGAALKLKAGKGTKAVSLAPGATKNVKVACPAGQAPTGAGYDERPGVTGTEHLQYMRYGRVAKLPPSPAPVA